MKKTYSILMLAMLMIAAMCFTACGGGDDEKSGSSSPNYNGIGKRITKLIMERKNSSSSTNNTYRVEYDQLKRLTKVIHEGAILGYDDKTQQYIYGDEELLSIDYNTNSFTFYSTNRNRNKKRMFRLNQYGYVSQLEAYILKYDANGYLIEGDNSEQNFNINYSNNDITRMVLNTMKGNIRLAYYTYSHSNTGELLITITSEKYISLGDEEIVGFIAYQSGLFGRISKYCTEMSNSKYSITEFNSTDEAKTNSRQYRCTIVYEE